MKVSFTGAYRLRLPNPETKSQLLNKYFFHCVGEESNNTIAINIPDTNDVLVLNGNDARDYKSMKVYNNRDGMPINLQTVCNLMSREYLKNAMLLDFTSVSD